jgi:hypothetical protein
MAVHHSGVYNIIHGASQFLFNLRINENKEGQN